MTVPALPLFVFAFVLLSVIGMAQGSSPDGQALLRDADSLLRTKQVEAAMERYEALLARPGLGQVVKAGVLVGMGQGFLFKSRPDTALSFFLKAVNVLGNPPLDTTMLTEAYSGIGIVHAYAKHLPLAASYFERALALPGHPPVLRLKLLTNLAGVYLEQKQLDGAQHLFEEALTLSRQTQFASVEASILTNLSNLYIGRQSWQRAEQYAEQSLSLRREKKLPETTVTLNNLGYAQQQLGKTGAAVVTYRKALAAANGNEKVQVLHNLQQVHSAQGDFRSATEALKLQLILKDSLHALQVAEKVAEINTLYETAEKQRQIDALQATNRAQRDRLVYWLAVAAFLLVFIGTVVWLRIRQLRTQQALEKSQIRQQLFRAQLNPHFIFNAMERINQFIRQNDRAASSAYLYEFSVLLRRILETSDKAYVSLAEELGMLRHYLNVQQMESGEQWQYEIAVAPGLDEESISTPVMLIQPLVENAVVHGVRSRKDGRIVISVSRQQDDLVVDVMDNGPGIRTASEQAGAGKHRSFGSRLVRQQISEYNKGRKHPIRLSVSDAQPGETEFPGTCVSLRIPVFE